MSAALEKFTLQVTVNKSTPVTGAVNMGKLCTVASISWL